MLLFMKSLKFLMMVIGLLVAGIPVLGQERVPLVDRDLFFGDPEIGGAQISPDGRFIAFVKPFQGTLSLIHI